MSERSKGSGERRHGLGSRDGAKVGQRQRRPLLVVLRWSTRSTGASQEPLSTPPCTLYPAPSEEPLSTWSVTPCVVVDVEEEEKVASCDPSP